MQRISRNALHFQNESIGRFFAVRVKKKFPKSAAFSVNAADFYAFRCSCYSLHFR